MKVHSSSPISVYRHDAVPILERPSSHRHGFAATFVADEWACNGAAGHFGRRMMKERLARGWPILELVQRMGRRRSGQDGRL
jgi:hypothetical protein